MNRISVITLVVVVIYNMHKQYKHDNVVAGRSSKKSYFEIFYVIRCFDKAFRLNVFFLKKKEEEEELLSDLKFCD